MEWVSQITVGKSSHKAVLVALCNYHHNKNGRCDPSVSSIATFTELNRKTVIAAIKSLEDSELITPIKRFGSTTNYQINFGSTGPKNGTAKRKDTSSNFGTGDMTQTSTKNGTGPNLGPVPKTEPDQYQKRPQPVPNLGHKQGTGINGKKVNLLVEDEKTTPDKNLSTNPKNEPYLRAAHAMWERIQPITHDKREPNFEKWANDIRLLIENDDKDPQEVWRVFTWANQDSFWQSNILSPAKLRKQFGQLVAKSGAGTNKFEQNLQVGMQWLEARSERSGNL